MRFENMIVTSHRLNADGSESVTLSFPPDKPEQLTMDPKKINLIGPTDPRSRNWQEELTTMLADCNLSVAHERGPGLLHAKPDYIAYWFPMNEFVPKVYERLVKQVQEPAACRTMIGWEAGSPHEEKLSQLAVGDNVAKKKTGLRNIADCVIDHVLAVAAEKAPNTSVTQTPNGPVTIFHDFKLPSGTLELKAENMITPEQMDANRRPARLVFNPPRVSGLEYLQQLTDLKALLRSTEIMGEELDNFSGSAVQIGLQVSLEMVTKVVSAIAVQANLDQGWNPSNYTERDRDTLRRAISARQSGKTEAQTDNFRHYFNSPAYKDMKFKTGRAVGKTQPLPVVKWEAGELSIEADTKIVSGTLGELIAKKFGDVQKGMQAPE